jgi:predicted O-methyltransferase YrrM
MNPVLLEILRTRDSGALSSGVSPEEGEFLQSIVEEIKPEITLETGFAYGISALFICEALQKVKGKKHIVIDPSPFWSYEGIGFRNIKKAKYKNTIKFINAPSETALPDLIKQGIRIDFAFIDGWHTFDHALLDFFYINKMLNVDGVVAFDDAQMPSINKLCRYISRYPCYKIYGSWPAKQNFGILKVVSKTFVDLVQGQIELLKQDLSILGRRCIAFRKISTDQRKYYWYSEF